MIQLKVGGKYNWCNQPERLAYMGVGRYSDDPREWHQFEKVTEPGVVWCEVLTTELASFEETVVRPPIVSSSQPAMSRRQLRRANSAKLRAAKQLKTEVA